MTTVSCTLSNTDNYIKTVTWASIANGNDGVPISMCEFADRTIQVTGTFGAGGNLRWEGSNDGGTTWAALNDPFGTALNITAANVKGVTEITALARPRVTAGDGTTALIVTLFARNSRTPRGG